MTNIKKTRTSKQRTILAVYCRRPETKNVKTRLAGHIPENPAEFVETSYETMPHHIVPARSVDDYLRQEQR